MMTHLIPTHFSVKGLAKGLAGKSLLSTVSVIAGVVLTTGMGLAAPLVIANNSTPITRQGTSGGPTNSDCGFVATQPNESIQITEDFVNTSGYLRFEVQGAASTTLLIEGPTGRFCVLGDRLSNRNPQIAGRWLPGLYKIRVGDRNGQQTPYTLSISSVAN